ncbi:uncharacterized protein Dmul_03150 [Desulfococcus multivorans]|nr:uncharacterized protein Dmul_03150 [Desulfococcus multivorans]
MTRASITDPAPFFKGIFATARMLGVGQQNPSCRSLSLKTLRNLLKKSIDVCRGRHYHRWRL